VSDRVIAGRRDDDGYDELLDDDALDDDTLDPDTLDADDGVETREEREAARPPYVFAALLILFGVVGWIAAFALTLDKFAVTANPDADLSCNFSVLIGCGANLNSAQGSVFGFPNPLLGLGGFIAPIVVGVGLLAGGRFAAWFWRAFNVGVALAFAFVVFLITTSIYALATLCPWCMTVWAVVIPMFWMTTAYAVKHGVWGSSPGIRRLGAAAYQWVPLITLGSYLVVAVLAQLQLDVVNNAF
jgi:uncharacterized membrane protein